MFQILKPMKIIFHLACFVLLTIGPLHERELGPTPLHLLRRIVGQQWLNCCEEDTSSTSLFLCRFGLPSKNIDMCKRTRRVIIYSLKRPTPSIVL